MKTLFMFVLLLLMNHADSTKCFVSAQKERITGDCRARGHFKEETNSVPPNLDQVCDDDYFRHYDHIVYVDPTKTGTKSDCDSQVFAAQPHVTCHDINTALQLHANSTAYVFSSGTNVTHYLKGDTAGDTTSFFSGLSNVGFFGSGNSSEPARIQCLDNAGLAFWNVDEVRVHNVEFSNCGALRKSTSKDFTKQNYFTQIKVGLYFYNGSNVTMCRVTVQNGIGALGAVMYDIDGTVNVYSSTFSNNTVSRNFTLPGGGGLVVEFSYCVPGDRECTLARRQTTHNADSSYTFYRCFFANNKARTVGGNRPLLSGAAHDGFGRGGGLAVFFKGDASSNTLWILDCQFLNNQALWGGGLCVDFLDGSRGNSVIINESLFWENSCYSSTGVGGGGIRILSVLMSSSGSNSDDSMEGNKMNISGYFGGNSAVTGGAISFSPAFEKKLHEKDTVTVHIANSVFSENKALLGAAIHVDLHSIFVNGIVNYVTIEGSEFLYNVVGDATEPSNYDIGIGVVYAFHVPLQFQSRLRFSHNYGSALAIVSTHAKFYDSAVSFVGNRGDTGGAIAFLGSSHALVNENTSMYFEENFARQGAAIYNYITSQGRMESDIACFIRYSDPVQSRRFWKANFTFVNNTSTRSGNSIYSASVYPCALDNIEQNLNLTETLLFCINPYWNFVGSNCIDEIETEGSTYTFLNDSTLIAFPGQGFELPISVSDELNHNITSSVGYTSSVSSENRTARVDPKFTLTSGNFLSITGMQNSTVHLQLQSSGSRPHYLKIDVELLTCPPGFHFYAPEMNVAAPDNKNYLGKCKCKYMYSFRNHLNCSMQNFQAQIPWNFWIGLDPTGQREGQLVMSELPNFFSEQDIEDLTFFVLPKSSDQLDEDICGVRNRTGPVCGQCKKNFSTSINSYDYSCTLCDEDTDFVKNILLFMTFAYIPYIILLGAIIYFNLKFTSSSTSGFILFAQMVSLDIFDVNSSSGIAINNFHMHKAYLFVYGLFNFNSFANVMQPFCIGRNFTVLHVLLLEYTLAALPLLVIVCLYFLLRCKSIRCMCCHKQKLSIQSSLLLRLPRSMNRKKKKQHKSLVHALVAFILLSYTKLSLVSMKMLSTTKLYDEDGHYLSDPRLYLAGHLSFYSKEYLLPFGLIAMFVVVLFVAIPPLFLLGVPQLIDRLLDKERFSCLRKVWPTVIIHIILDAFQGFYKPNRRFFAGVYFVFRLAILLVYATTSNYLNMYMLQQLLIVLMIVLLAVFKPYKREVFNVVDILIFLNLSVINLISAYVYASSLTVVGLDQQLANAMYVIQYFLVWLPLLYMLSYLLYKLTISVGIYQLIVGRIHKHRGRSQDRNGLYFTDNSEMGGGRSGESDNDGGLSNLDSLSDAALFCRAKDTNTFRQPAHIQKRKMHSVVAEPNQNVVFDTESTENGTNSS